MKMEIEEIYNFLIEHYGIKRSELFPGKDLCLDLGIDGDDFFELEELFAEKFSVNMDNYCWYFHHGEEGLNLGALFFSPPYNQVEHIAVSPVVLLESAKANVWSIEYPEHSLIKGRPDMEFNKYFFIVIAILGLLFGVVYSST